MRDRRWTGLQTPDAVKLNSPFSELNTEYSGKQTISTSHDAVSYATRGIPANFQSYAEPQRYDYQVAQGKQYYIAIASNLAAFTPRTRAPVPA